MSVSEKHPDLTAARLDEWKLIENALEGESAIKAAGTAYLPCPASFKGKEQGDAYREYKMRARFPAYLAPSVSAMMGVMHGQEVGYQTPDNMKALRENIDGEGRSLERFHELLTRELLTYGRAGILVDAKPTSNQGELSTYLSIYKAPAIINWDNDFYVLDESGMQRDGFGWAKVERYRVLRLVDGKYTQELYDKSVGQKEPELQGEIAAADPWRKGIPRVPFTIANWHGLTNDVKAPPLIQVANEAVSAYQLNADLRLQLFMSGQATLVLTGSDEKDMQVEVGPNAAIFLPATGDVKADAKYVEPSGSGIRAHMDHIAQVAEEAQRAGARLFSEAPAHESGEAKRLRYRSETATLKGILNVSCAAMERALRDAAMFLNIQGIDQIVVTPPETLIDSVITPEVANALRYGVEAGIISNETYYEILSKSGLALPELEEEKRRIAAETFGVQDATDTP